MTSTFALHLEGYRLLWPPPVLCQGMCLKWPGGDACLWWELHFDVGHKCKAADGRTSIKWISITVTVLIRSINIHCWTAVMLTSLVAQRFVNSLKVFGFKNWDSCCHFCHFCFSAFVFSAFVGSLIGLMPGLRGSVSCLVKLTKISTFPKSGLRFVLPAAGNQAGGVIIEHYARLIGVFPMTEYFVPQSFEE